MMVKLYDSVTDIYFSSSDGDQKNMYEKIKEEIKQDYYTQYFSNDGEKFIAWYLRNIHGRDKNETRDDITDGSDDKQIDAVVIDDEKSTIFVIQGKFIGSNRIIDAAPLREVLSSWIQLRDLARLQEVANNKLKRRLAEIGRVLEEDEYEISFELITTAPLSPSATEDLATFQKQLAELSERDGFTASITLIDTDELRRRYELAVERENPYIRHTITLEEGKFLSMAIAGTQVVLAAIPLKACLEIPGIKDGALFQKNVRQSLGLNAVNKEIRRTIYSEDKFKDFFFFHNGITAICNRMTLSNGTLELGGLSVVNGCQSLNTILYSSERVKQLDETYIMFRFYEIPQRDRADRISISTNSQSAVKPRDLKSNDKRVLSLKNSFEQRYPMGYLVTKRGETYPAEKDKRYVVDLSDLAKYLMSWHTQRPNVAYSETKIFDKYFDQLFKADYRPENIQALNFWMHEVAKNWTPENPIGLNESLLAMKAYAPFHQLYAISMCFAISNNQRDSVPDPYRCYEAAEKGDIVAQVAEIAGRCLNAALEAASSEIQPANRVFSPQNWTKTKTCLAAINAAITNYFSMLPMMPGGKEYNQKLKQFLTIPREDFEYRWKAAD
jgi:hypothetical protein